MPCIARERDLVNGIGEESMFEWKRSCATKKIMLTARTVITAAICSLSFSACTTHGVNGSLNTKNSLGSVPLDSLKVGMPEHVFKDSILTFVPDPSPAATAGGKIQYDSRNYNVHGGQYFAQCKNDKCFEMQVYFVTNPIPKEEALDTVKQLLPTEAPPQSKVDDTQLKSGSSEPVESYFFGNLYRGELQYADKAASKVKIVSVIAVKDEAAPARAAKTADSEQSKSY
jgi:hypothetical protein